MPQWLDLWIAVAFVQKIVCNLYILYVQLLEPDEIRVLFAHMEWLMVKLA